MQYGVRLYLRADWKTFRRLEQWREHFDNRFGQTYVFRSASPCFWIDGTALEYVALEDGAAYFGQMCVVDEAVGFKVVVEASEIHVG